MKNLKNNIWIIVGLVMIVAQLVVTTIQYCQITNSRETKRKNIQAKYEDICNDKPRHENLNIVNQLPENYKTDLIKSSFTNDVFTFTNVRRYKYNCFMPNKLLETTPYIEVPVGNTLIIDKDEYLVFDFAGDTYMLNYWCNDENNHTVASLKKNTSSCWDGIFENTNCRIKTDCADYRSTRKDGCCKCYFKFERINKKGNN